MSENKVVGGVTKWFDKKKGYGFVTSDDGKDFFIHFSNISMEGYKVLEKGQKVRFEVKPDVKGPQAVNVSPVTE